MIDLLINKHNIHILSIKIDIKIILLRIESFFFCIIKRVYIHNYLSFFCSNFVLDISEGIHDVSHFRVEIAMCLLIVWLIVFFCLVKGVKSMGKVKQDKSPLNCLIFFYLTIHFRFRFCLHLRLSTLRQYFPISY